MKFGERNFSRQLKLHGQNSRDIRSRNIMVILSLGERWSYISVNHAFRA